MSKPRALKGKAPGPRRAPKPMEPIELLVKGAAQLTDLVRELGQLRDHRAATERWLDDHGGDAARKEISALMVEANPDKYSLRSDGEATDLADPPADGEESPQPSGEPQESDTPPLDPELEQAPPS